MAFGRQGRPPKLAQLKMAEGDLHKLGKKKLERLCNAVAAPDVDGLGACPEHLTGVARKQWDELSSQLHQLGIDKRPDANALEGACQAYAHARASDELIARNGLIIETFTTNQETGEKELGETFTNPACNLSVKFWTMYSRFCSEFGLTPISRQRIAGSGKDQASAMKELQEMLSRPRDPRTPIGEATSPSVAAAATRVGKSVVN